MTKTNKVREKVSSVETHQTSSSTIQTKSTAANQLPKTKSTSQKTSIEKSEHELRIGDRLTFERKIGQKRAEMY